MSLAICMLEEVVKQHGELFCPESKRVFDDTTKYVELFKQKYNSESLSMEQYREAYSRKELPWQ